MMRDYYYVEVLRELQKKGFVTIVGKLYTGTKISQILLQPKAVKLFLVRNKSSVKKEVATWIQEYRNLFPKGLNSLGYPYKGDKNGCIDKMATFILNNPEYTKDLILKVTNFYIDEKKKDNFDYMKQAHYFIEKDRVSSLAAYCEQFGEEGLETSGDNMINF